MTAHGFAGTVGGSGNVSVFGVSFNGVDPQSALFQSALKACQEDLPGGGPKALSPSQLAGWLRAMDRFAGCMRKHGVPSFPDPSSQGDFPFGGLKGIDPSSSIAQKAFNACQSLEPTFGPRIGF